MARFNRFGKVYTNVISMYPGTVVADYDAGGANGQTNIEAAIDRATLEVSSALRPDVFKALTQVENELTVRYATQGQTSWTLGMIPVIAGSLHMWVYPLVLPDGGIGVQSNFATYPFMDAYYRAPSKGWLEAATTDYSLNATTGVVTWSGAAIPLGSRIFSTYDVDSDNAAFAIPQLGQIALMGAAAELGAILYSDGNQDYQLVAQYRQRYADSLKLLQEGGLVPDEVRKLNYFQEIERASSTVNSVRLGRG